MATLKELVAEHSTRTIKLLGMELPARLIDGPMQRLLQERWPAPQPPMWKNPNKGSAAEEEPNREDPVYQLRFAVWIDQFMALTVGLSIVNAGGAAELGLEDLRAGLPDFPENRAGLDRWTEIMKQVLGVMERLPTDQITAAHQRLCAAPGADELETIRKKSAAGAAS